MKKIMKFWIGVVVFLCIQSQASMAQTMDEARMKRDIEVAENVLTTLIKQEMEIQRAFFGLDVKGSYQPGYGVTFRLPPDQLMPFTFSVVGDMGLTRVISGGNYQYSITTNGSSQHLAERDDVIKLKEKSQIKADSARAIYNDRIIAAAKNFILDYGDFISQLQPNEKIVVTNQGDRPHFLFNSGKRSRISVEGSRADIVALRQGKISRDQALKKLTVVDTESVATREPDMEMLSSIFSRLYRPDLSKTYYVEGNVYYERLKDYGAIFYMQMVSSVGNYENRFSIPTLDLDNLSQDARDKKVTELYPVFEQDIKENILEYGRTLKSLNDDEILVFNIALTKCAGCGIPGTLELTIKSAVLKAYGSAKMDQNTAMGKFTVKKTANQ